MAHADSVQAGLMTKVREVDTSTEGKKQVEVEDEALRVFCQVWAGLFWKFGRLEEVEEETNRGKEDKEDIFEEVVVKCVTLHLQVI